MCMLCLMWWGAHCKGHCDVNLPLPLFLSVFPLLFGFRIGFLTDHGGPLDSKVFVADSANSKVRFDY